MFSFREIIYIYIYIYICVFFSFVFIKKIIIKKEKKEKLNFPGNKFRSYMPLLGNFHFGSVSLFFLGFWGISLGFLLGNFYFGSISLFVGFWGINLIMMFLFVNA
jgi:hypothetical protein